MPPKPKLAPVEVTLDGRPVRAALRIADGAWQLDLRALGGGRVVLGSVVDLDEAGARARAVGQMSRPGGSKAGGSPTRVARQAGRTVADLLERWEATIVQGGATAAHAAKQRRTAEVTLELLSQLHPGWTVAGATRSMMGDLARALPAWLQQRMHERLAAGRTVGVTLGDKHAGTTVARHLGALRAWWYWLIDEELATTNPVARLRAMPSMQPEYPYDAIHPRVVADILTEAWDRNTRRGNEWFGAMVAIALHTGVRPDELEQLMVGDLDLDGHEGPRLLVRSIVTGRRTAGTRQSLKTRGSRRAVPLPPAVLPFLYRHLEQLAAAGMPTDAESWLWPSKEAQSQHLTTVSDSWAALMQRHGLDPIGHRAIRCCRDTYATASLLCHETGPQGQPLPINHDVVSRRLGHTQATTIDRYRDRFTDTKPSIGLDYFQLAGKRPPSFGRYATTRSRQDAGATSSRVAAKGKTRVRQRSSSERKRHVRPKR